MISSEKTSGLPEQTPEEYLAQRRELYSNPATMLLLTVCVDCSFSMLQKKRLHQVLEGLELMRQEISKNKSIAQSVEICIISYGGDRAVVESDFVSVSRLVIPQLKASGATPLGQAAMAAQACIQARMNSYSSIGNSCFKPRLIFIGDGDATDEECIPDAARRLAEMGCSVLCITVGEEDSLECASLLELSPQKKVYYLQDINFKRFFLELSNSVVATSKSTLASEGEYVPTGDVATVLERNKPH